MKLTIFGSCRQRCLGNMHSLTNIQEYLTYPHYSKEVVQAIEFCLGKSNIPEEMTQNIFRSGIINKITLNPNEFKEAMLETDLFVIEIASRIAYKYKGFYAHHILKDKEYGFTDIENIEVYNLTDDEIEDDIIKMRDLLYPKPFMIVSHIYTRSVGKRYDLVMLLNRICNKYSIPFFDPMFYLNNIPPIIVFEDEPVLSHYTSQGEAIISNFYDQFINNIDIEKTIIYTWVTNACNFIQTDTYAFWGIGDILRGIAYMYNLSKEFNYNFIADFSNHPISNLLEGKQHIYSKFISENKDTVMFMLNDEVLPYMSMHTTNYNMSYFMTNGQLSTWDTMGEDCKGYIRNLFKLNKTMQTYVDSFKINMTDYNILHFRLGDKYLLGGCTDKFEHLYKCLKNVIPHNCIFMSDSNQFKNYVRNIDSSIYMLDIKATHVGLCEDSDSIMGTLLEFIVASKASKIFTYSANGWVSGFVNSIHKIYDIPLIDLENQINSMSSA